MNPERAQAIQPLLGNDPTLRAVLSRATLVAPTTTPVLVTGESGTGKELLAHMVHDLGLTPRGPLVAVNCGALPRELAESELFGHERGAFTGAAGRRAGWFEQASGGTLVLDEIGELPLELQPKLLRVLETGRLRRVGGAGETAVRVRVVAMTLRNLESEVQRGGFRADLFYRLAGFQLVLPPLRQRPGDVPLLARHFLREIEGEIPGAGPRELTPEALAALAAYDWPGNVRELRNVIRRAAIITRERADQRIDAAALELAPAGSTPPGSPPAAGTFAPAPLIAHGESHLRDGPPDPPRDDRRGPQPARTAGDLLQLTGRTFDEIEREVFSWALRRHDGSRRRAARSLAIARSTFCDKVKRLGIA